MLHFATFWLRMAVKDLENLPPHLQRMLLQLHCYDLIIKYWLGKDMLVSEVPSRCPGRSNPEIKLDVQVDYTRN